MSSLNDRIRAFPTVRSTEALGNSTAQIETVGGMFLRDYFAAQLLAGVVLNCGDGCVGYMEQRAKVAYQFADVMLAERLKRYD